MASESNLYRNYNNHSRGWLKSAQTRLIHTMSNWTLKDRLETRHPFWSSMIWASTSWHSRPSCKDAESSAIAQLVVIQLSIWSSKDCRRQNQGLRCTSLSYSTIACHSWMVQRQPGRSGKRYSSSIKMNRIGCYCPNYPPNKRFSLAFAASQLIKRKNTKKMPLLQEWTISELSLYLRLIFRIYLDKLAYSD